MGEDGFHMTHFQLAFNWREAAAIRELSKDHIGGHEESRQGKGKQQECRV